MYKKFKKVHFESLSLGLFKMLCFKLSKKVLNIKSRQIYICFVSRDISTFKYDVAVVCYQFPVNLMYSTISIIRFHLKPRKYKLVSNMYMFQGKKMKNYLF